MQNSKIKNIIFDLGGVLFRRDPKKCTPDFIDFFAFVRFPKMPLFWEEYDRGTYSLDEVIDLLCREKGVSREQCVEYVRLAIDKQELEMDKLEQTIKEMDAKGKEIEKQKRKRLHMYSLILEIARGKLAATNFGAVFLKP